MPGPTVVVGIDDSASARTALAWAADWARRNNARLRAVHVLTPGLDIAPGWYPGAMGWVPVPDLAIDPARDRQRVSELFNSATRGVLTATLEFADGPVGPALIKASRGAALLVVGTRQLRGIARALDGSVSHYCLARAACPVLAVPAVPTVPVAVVPERDVSVAS